MKTPTPGIRAQREVPIVVESVGEPSWYRRKREGRGGETQELSIDSIFAALDEAAVLYCLLREYEEPSVSEQRSEIDLLVNPGHLALLSEILAGKGFVALPRWGHHPHHFFVAYDQARGLWIKFDVVTELRYGKPIRRFEIDLAQSCLRERRRHGAMYGLSPENEFITLFLHCLLDKAEFRAKHCARLLTLRNMASRELAIDRRISELIERYLPPPINWSAIADAIDKGDWQSLLNWRSEIGRKFFWRAPITSVWRDLSGRIARRLRPLLFALFRRGMTVALLAPDGAGKSTLALHLSRDPYLRARLIYMGTNINAEGIRLPTTRWIHGRLKKLQVNGAKLELIALKGFGFANRVVEQWYRSAAAMYHVSRGRVVIYDRYIYDSWLAPRSPTPSKRLRRWMLESAFPAPDLVVLLDAPGEMLYKRKGEHSPEWLEQQRQGYLKLAERVPQMVVVDARQNADEVRREAASLIWDRYGVQGRKRK